MRFIVSPRFSEQWIQLLFDRFFTGIKGNHAFRIMGSKEQWLPGISLTIHIGIIRIVRIEILDPAAIGNLSAPKARTRVKQILIIAGTFHQCFINTFISQLLSQQSGRIIIVCIFHSLCYSGFVFIPGRDIGGILFCNPSLFDVFIQIWPAAFSRDSGIIHQQFISPVQIEVLQAT